MYSEGSTLHAIQCAVQYADKRRKFVILQRAGIKQQRAVFHSGHQWRFGAQQAGAGVLHRSCQRENTHQRGGQITFGKGPSPNPRHSGQKGKFGQSGGQGAPQGTSVRRIQLSPSMRCS